MSGTVQTWARTFLLCLPLPCLDSAAHVHGHTFERLSSTTLGIIPAATYRDKNTASSALACGIRCQSKHWSAYFIHNPALATCTCAAALHASGSLPSGSDELYVYTLTSRCDLTSGFNIYVYKSAAVCLLVGSEEKSYERARNACSQFTNGRLFISDTPDKLGVAGNLEQIQSDWGNVWVGLDDIDSEGVYVWADGRIAQPATMTEMFVANQPDNFFNGEDCIHFLPASKLLNDDPCWRSWQYICEMDVSI